jgi:hypothetical protein
VVLIEDGASRWTWSTCHVRARGNAAFAALEQRLLAASSIKLPPPRPSRPPPTGRLTLPGKPVTRLKADTFSYRAVIITACGNDRFYR